MEQLGIARSREALADAAIVLVVLDATQPLNQEERDLLAAAHGRSALVAIKQKRSPLNQDQTKPHWKPLNPAPRNSISPPCPTSALTGDGIPLLREKIVQLATGGAAAEPGLVTNLRQQQAILAARIALEDGRRANDAAIPHEMILIDLYRALWALDSLTGQTTPDDILNLIFSTFCIGK